MSFIEDTIKKTRTIERLLTDLGGNGKGLHEKATSIESVLPETLLIRLRFVASIRNQLMHADGFVFQGNEDAFCVTCDKVIAELETLIVLRKNKGLQSIPNAGLSDIRPTNKLIRIIAPDSLVMASSSFSDAEERNNISASTQAPRRTRRWFLNMMVGASVGGVGWFAAKQLMTPEIARAANFVKPETIWMPNNFYDFLKALPQANMLYLQQQLDIVDQKTAKTKCDDPSKDAVEIQKYTLWKSSNVIFYPFRDPRELDYHALVQWVAEKAGVDKWRISFNTTFRLEHELQKLVFAEMWNKLNPRQRMQLLEKVDPHGSITNKAAIASLSGAGAIAALSTTVAFSGFAFYTTMSVTIAAVASALGITLPFAAYAGASTAVGVLSGPIGWAVMGLAALGRLALAGRANAKETAALISRIHALKIEALMAAGVPAKKVFPY